jgi:DNA-binding transcriptional ArsR family regulator
MQTIEGGYDYDAEDVLTVRDPEQLKALGDELRSRIVALLRERAASTTELAAALGLPKGTVGHHVKVLERAGLIHVVRTRQVRAVTEKFYGRVARLFVLKGDEEHTRDGGGALAAVLLRQAADELLITRPTTDESALVHARLSPADARRLTRRLGRLVDDFLAADQREGDLHALAVAVFPTRAALPPRDDA